MYNFTTTLKKSILGFIYTLTAVIVSSIAQTLVNYHPGGDTPTWLMTIYLAIIPTVAAALTGWANWLKNKDKGNANPN